MSCQELERLLLSEEPESQALAHRASCPSCDAMGRQMKETEGIISNLKPPQWSFELRSALLEIPQQTVCCEEADRLLAFLLEKELREEDNARLERHLSRCEACREASAALLTMRGLAAPEAAPYLATRVAAARPPRRRSWVRWMLDPKAVVAYAYAATLVLMLLGFNPADVAYRADENARAAVTSAGSALVDRLGSFQERAFRTLQVWKGRAGGYGRAAVSKAVTLVLKTEAPPAPARPRGRGESGAFQRMETILNEQA